MGNKKSSLVNPENNNSLFNRFEQAREENNFTAIVGGATGATGRWIVKELAEDLRCTKVIALTRRPILDLKAVFDTSSSKIVVAQIDWNHFVARADLACLGEQGATVAFSCFGSNPVNDLSDFKVPQAFAQACKKLQVFCLLLHIYFSL